MYNNYDWKTGYPQEIFQEYKVFSGCTVQVQNLADFPEITMEHPVLLKKRKQVIHKNMRK